MKLLVGYNGGEEGRMALSLARDHAVLHDAFVYIVNSSEGGSSEKQSDIIQAEEGLAFASFFMEQAGVKCETLQSVRGLSAGEDLVQFAIEKRVDHIFLGIRKKSKAQKAVMGSTSRHVILKAPCPVTTVRFDLKNLTNRQLLRHRMLLVVDDEPDIVETIEELLDVCTIFPANSYETAKDLLSGQHFDLAVLDIMGVRGYDILELARNRDIPALMLTAHALSPENLKESIEKGADSYVPKDELANIPDHVADVLRNRFAGGQGYGAWFGKLRPFFDKTFGKGWREKDRNFWDSFDDKYGV